MEAETYIEPDDAWLRGFAANMARIILKKREEPGYQEALERARERIEAHDRMVPV